MSLKSRFAWFVQLLVAATGLRAAAAAPAAAEPKSASSALAFTLKDIDGHDVALSRYEGKVVLIVNVASKCGNTKQYKELQALHEKYAKQGLAVLGFPANNFRGQEPGSDADIKEFCTAKFGVSFPMFSKISVKGDDIHPLYKHLTTGEGDAKLAGDITWNFEKILLGRDGKMIGRFTPKTMPDAKPVVDALEAALAAPAPGSAPDAAPDKPKAPVKAVAGPLAFTVKDIDGKEHDLAQHAGKVVLVVNVASKCGYTGQYADLVKLHEKYAQDGLVILGFPANNYLRQEPGSDAEIKEFCSKKYGVPFPMMSKVSVLGDDIHPLFKLLAADPKLGGDIKWNFEKHLIGRDGALAGHFRSGDGPTGGKVVAAIEGELKKKTELSAAGAAVKAAKPAGDGDVWPIDEPKGEQPRTPPGPVTYQGRKIAFTMHWMAADWLTRNEREREEATTVMIRELKLKEGMGVADLGCGNGYHAIPMAKLVGPKGTIYGVDIQREMLVFLNRRAKKESVANIRPILGTLTDPRLPEASCDVVLLVDAYHEFSHPQQMLAGIRKALKPNGRMVLVEFRGEDPAVPIKPDHKMSKEQILKEIPLNGFKLVESYDKLPWQHMMSFEPAPLPAAP